MNQQLAESLREAIQERSWEKVRLITQDIEDSIPEQGLKWCYGTNHSETNGDHPLYFEHRALMAIGELRLSMELFIGHQGQLIDLDLQLFDYNRGRGTVLVLRS